MNFKKNESQQKLSGSYYTPKWLAGYIMRWVLTQNTSSVLEPSCGDGVFFEAINELETDGLIIKGFDINAKAIDICKEKLTKLNITSEIVTGDFIEWALINLNSNIPQQFDAVVGNPPFIRYQYLEKEMQDKAQTLFERLGIKFSKHTNAWIPFVLASVEFLKPGGRIGMVIPSEVLHVLYTKELRKYLLEHCSKVLFIDPEDLWFEGTLQGAMILMAEKKQALDMESEGVAIVRTKGTSFADRDPNMLFNTADFVSGSFLKNKWTYALLTKKERATYKKICSSGHVKKFIDLAEVDVGIVTGANSFFLVNDEIVDKYNLHDVASPMFGRSEHCPGIIYDTDQHHSNSAKGIPTNFLYFEDECIGDKFKAYLETGELQELQNRYKCRIRKPWYKVPSIYASPISMLKRSNGMPRLILNSLNAYTTDTAYRITPHDNIDPSAMVKCFLNSLTALSAELEGRHYGGGVLELVPSEIERLAVPYTTENFVDIRELNTFVKNHTVDEIIDFQDKRLFHTIGVDSIDAQILWGALQRLKRRRQRVEEPGDE